MPIAPHHGGRVLTQLGKVVAREGRRRADDVIAEADGAVELLDRLLARMDQHIFKKTPTLRALKSW